MTTTQKVSTQSNPNSARGLVRVARELADTVQVPLRTHRMRKVNAMLAINSILNQGAIGRTTMQVGSKQFAVKGTGTWTQDDYGMVVIRMGGAR